MIGTLAQKARQRLAKLFGGTSRGPDGPPPPVDWSFETIEAWARTNLDMEGWTYLGPQGGSVLLTRWASPAERFTVDMRTETFATFRDDAGRPIRSQVMSFEVLAETQSMRETEEVSYRKSNLQEPHPQLPAGEHEWFGLRAAEGRFLLHVRDLCARARGAAAEGPDSLLHADVDAWIGRTVEPGEDVYSHWDETGAVYVRPSSVRRLGKGRYALTSRVESFYPYQGGFRSWTEALELDLRDRSKTIGAIRAHPGHNFNGEALDATAGERVHAGERGFLPLHFDRLCRLAEEFAP